VIRRGWTITWHASSHVDEVKDSSHNYNLLNVHSLFSFTPLWRAFHCFIVYSFMVVKPTISDRALRFTPYLIILPDITLAVAASSSSLGPLYLITPALYRTTSQAFNPLRHSKWSWRTAARDSKPSTSNRSGAPRLLCSNRWETVCQMLLWSHLI